MVNILTYLFIAGLVFWILKIISRKQQELAEKEKQQREVFLKETQSLLKTETSSFSVAVPEESKPTHGYCNKVAEYFTSNGYSITEASKAEGIDLIGIQERALLLIRCESKLKEVKIADLKIFIAECSIYLDNNPIFKGRSYRRVYASQRPITEEARLFIRQNTSSIHLIEDI